MERAAATRSFLSSKLMSYFMSAPFHLIKSSFWWPTAQGNLSLHPRRDLTPFQLYFPRTYQAVTQWECNATPTMFLTTRYAIISLETTFENFINKTRLVIHRPSPLIRKHSIDKCRAVKERAVGQAGLHWSRGRGREDTARPAGTPRPNDQKSGQARDGRGGCTWKRYTYSTYGGKNKKKKKRKTIYLKTLIINNEQLKKSFGESMVFFIAIYDLSHITWIHLMRDLLSLNMNEWILCCIQEHLIGSGGHWPIKANNFIFAI